MSQTSPQKIADHRALSQELERTEALIRVEEAKDVDDYSPGRLTQLMNHKECLKNRLNGTFKSSDLNFEIIQ